MWCDVVKWVREWKVIVAGGWTGSLYDGGAAGDAAHMWLLGGWLWLVTPLMHV